MDRMKIGIAIAVVVIIAVIYMIVTASDADGLSNPTQAPAPITRRYKSIHGVDVNYADPWWATVNKLSISSGANESPSGPYKDMKGDINAIKIRCWNDPKCVAFAFNHNKPNDDIWPKHAVDFSRNHENKHGDNMESFIKIPYIR